jgi:hypothetical protein
MSTITAPGGGASVTAANTNTTTHTARKRGRAIIESSSDDGDDDIRAGGVEGVGEERNKKFSGVGTTTFAKTGDGTGGASNGKFCHPSTASRDSVLDRPRRASAAAAAAAMKSSLTPTRLTLTRGIRSPSPESTSDAASDPDAAAIVNRRASGRRLGGGSGGSSGGGSGGLGTRRRRRSSGYVPDYNPGNVDRRFYEYRSKVGAPGVGAERVSSEEESASDLDDFIMEDGDGDEDEESADETQDGGGVETDQDALPSLGMKDGEEEEEEEEQDLPSVGKRRRGGRPGRRSSVLASDDDDDDVATTADRTSEAAEPTVRTSHRISSTRERKSDISRYQLGELRKGIDRERATIEAEEADQLAACAGGGDDSDGVEWLVADNDGVDYEDDVEEDEIAGERPEEVEESEEEEVEEGGGWVSCTCGALTDDDTPEVRWVQCDNARCRVWQHAACVGLDSGECDDVNLVWFCLHCETNGGGNAPPPLGKSAHTATGGGGSGGGGSGGGSSQKGNDPSGQRDRSRRGQSRRGSRGCGGRKWSDQVTEALQLDDPALVCSVLVKDPHPPSRGTVLSRWDPRVRVSTRGGGESATQCAALRPSRSLRALCEADPWPSRLCAVLIARLIPLSRLHYFASGPRSIEPSGCPAVEVAEA